MTDVSEQSVADVLPVAPPIIVGFTGTQKPIPQAQANMLRSFLGVCRSAGAEWMHHGDCIGADAMAGLFWWGLDGKVHLHPPLNASKRAFAPATLSEEAKEYLPRNRDIGDACTFLLAVPQGLVEEQRSGTWATVRYVRKLNKPICLIFPNGTMRWEMPRSAALLAAPRAGEGE